MKQFLKRLAIFIIPILIIGISFEILLRKIPNEYLYKKNYLDRNSKNIKILFLGNSHDYYGINPEYITYPSFNSSYISQSLDYDFAILEKYNKKWDSLKYVVLSIDYFSLYNKLETGAEAWRVKNYDIYYDIHISNSIINNTEMLSNKLEINLNRLGSYYLKHKPITCSKLGWGTNYHSKLKVDLVSAGKLAAKRHLATSTQNLDENIEILKSIIDFARTRGIKIILFTSPAYKTYVQNLDSNQLNTTVNTVNKIVSSNYNVKYFNLLTDTEFVKNDFYDADHLNELGAKKLTIKINDLIMKSEDSTKMR